MEDGLNDNDDKMIGFCMNGKKTVSEIARELKINPKNVSVRLDRLKKKGLIDFKREPGKTYVWTTTTPKTKEYFLRILKSIEDRGGLIKEDEYISLLPFSFGDPDKERFNAPLIMMFLRPKLVERYVKISPAGKEFLKDASKK
jgi:DNA-binding MarR family transcriptional regulator